MICICGNTPVRAIEILIDAGGDVDQGVAVCAELFTLLAIDDIGVCGLEVIGGDKRLLDYILNGFDVG